MNIATGEVARSRVERWIDEEPLCASSPQDGLVLLGFGKKRTGADTRARGASVLPVLPHNFQGK